MNSSMHDRANAARDSGVAATSEKYVESVKPPIDRSTFSPGCAAFSSRSWLKLPNRACPGSSATPVTLSSAGYGRW